MAHKLLKFDTMCKYVFARASVLTRSQCAVERDRWFAIRNDPSLATVEDWRLILEEQDLIPRRPEEYGPKHGPVSEDEAIASIAREWDYWYIRFADPNDYGLWSRRRRR